MKMVMISFCNLQLLLLLCSCGFIVSGGIHPATLASGPSALPTKIVRDVCKSSSNYRFCVNSLMTDDRTNSLSTSPPHEQIRVIAEVAFSLAHGNISSTRDYITSLLANATGDHASQLQDCRDACDEISNEMTDSFDDILDDDLAVLALIADDGARAIQVCDAKFIGLMDLPRLYTKIFRVKRLFEICLAISKMFASI